MNEKVVVIGKRGLLAKSMIDYLKKQQFKIVIFSPNQGPDYIDITKKKMLIHGLDSSHPDLIINCSGRLVPL